jgi:hypothetical protein
LGEPRVKLGALFFQRPVEKIILRIDSAVFVRLQTVDVAVFENAIREG